MPKRSRSQAFGRDVLVVRDPPDDYYGLVTGVDEAVAVDGSVEYHVSFDCARVVWYDELDLNDLPDPTGIALAARIRFLVLMVSEGELNGFNDRLAAQGRSNRLQEGTWWLITPWRFHDLRGSLRVDVYRPAAGHRDPQSIADDNAVAEQMYVRPRLLVPLPILKLSDYAHG